MKCHKCGLATDTTLQEDWRQWWLWNFQSDDCEVPLISREFRDAWTLGVEAERRRKCKDEFAL